MSEDTEVKRLFAIARGHAKTALAKPVTQRESYLAFCRLNWKRYASGFSKSNTECERFANALDRATRDLVALIEEGGDAEIAGERRRLQFLRDSVEGAMDSVIVYEAAYAPDDVGGENSDEPPAPRTVTAADLDAALMEAETVTVEEMQAMAEAIAGEAEAKQFETYRANQAPSDDDEPVRYGRPVFALGAAGAAPLGSLPQAPKPDASNDEALAEMLPKIRQIIGQKLREG